MNDMLKHFQAKDDLGTEFISVCDRRHNVGRLSKKWKEVSAEDTFPHDTCDLCEFDRGELRDRLAFFVQERMLR